MIKAEDIYNVSNGGLDVILLCVGDSSSVREAILSGKKFALRNERTPSSSAKQYNNVWKVTDFGDTGHAESPIDLYMRVNGIPSFGEAVARLSEIFGLRDELNSTVNKPHIEKRPATQDQEEGKKYFEFNEKFTSSELKLLGPNVTQATCDALHWYSVKWVCDIKNREATYKFSNENYPIFMRECLVSAADGEAVEKKFYKIYEPLNPQKQWRFQYTPRGAKPREYINGFAELKERHRQLNVEEEKLFFQDPKNEDKPFKQVKLEEAIICSGERDALCCRALGYSPLWFNSETYKLTVEEYKDIMKYVKVLYNIPDLDSTGVLKGTELALRFIDIHTIWLPDWLSSYRDNRGKPRKDFRDWSDLRPKSSDFKKLLNLAKPAKFWSSRWSEKNKGYTYEVDSDCLRYFLRLNGFYTLHDENSSTPKYVRIEGNIVKSVAQKDISGFIIRWAEDNYLERDIRNLILNSPRIAGSAIANLQEVDLDFTKCTDHSQLFFFPKTTFEVTAEGIAEYQGRSSDLDRYVWEENVLQHNVRLLDPMFTISKKENLLGDTVFDITIHNTRSKFFGYLINTSRIHWRKELEYNFEDKSAEEARQYKAAHLFCIDGEGLTEHEVMEQKQNLVNKIFGIGFWLHRYKSASKAWALYAMDNKIDDEGECNGRSGKSFYFKVLSYFGKTVKLSGRNPKLMDNPHVFDQVTQHTDYIIVDDCDRYLQTGIFYDIITSDLTVNPKNNQSFTIPFEHSPKLAFTTNYVPGDFDPSTDARLVYLAFSDYYHQRTADNDYHETRSIRDDFGKDLFASDYSEAEWNEDCNFFMRCEQFYLSMARENLKLQPPMGNIIKRKLMSDMVGEFEEWADAYFAGEHLDTFVEKDEAMADFTKNYNIKGLSSQRFMRSLKAYATLNSYRFELNPAELQNASGRIIRKGKDNVSKVMLYMRSVARLKDEGSGFTPNEHVTDEYDHEQELPY